MRPIFTLLFFGLSCFLTTSQTLAARNFSANSGSINVGCDQWANTTVRFTLPQGARLLSGSYQWEDLSNVKESRSEERWEGNTLVITGSIRGLDLENLLIGQNCPGGGHGTLRVWGTYE